MKKRKGSPVSVREVALAAGVSKSTASYALQNHPGVNKQTRQRVLRIAKRLGYARDARLGMWMARVRDTKSKSLLPIGWLNTDPQFASFRDRKFTSPYLEGAEKRCHELGFHLDEIWLWQPGLSQQRISRILYHRGIEGVIVSHPSTDVYMDLDRLAAVSLEGALPRLHQVKSNLTLNLNLAIGSLVRLGYRRIGVCLTQQIDQFSHHLVRSTLYFWSSSLPTEHRVEPLFHSFANPEETKLPQVTAWLREQKPDVVICHDNHFVEWIRAAGYRVPEDIGVAHLALDDDVLDWAGIYSNRRMIGRAAVDLVISLMQGRQLGVPGTPGEMLFGGLWQSGRTLLPKAALFPR